MNILSGWLFYYYADPEEGYDIFINCFGNGCNNTYYWDDVEISTFIVNCDNSKNIACPLEANNPLFPNHPSQVNSSDIFWLDSSDINTRINNICDNSSDDSTINDTSSAHVVLIADDFESKNSFADGVEKIELIGENRYLCCRGTKSCSILDSIVLDWNVSDSKKANSTYTNDGAVYCSAYRSCNNITTIDISSARGNVNNVDIICSGSMSCINININFNDNDDNDDIRGIGNVYCFATGACMNSVINGATNIYCTVGSDNNNGACQNAIIQNVKNIYMLNGGPSEPGVTIYGRYGNETNIYFKAYYSGAGANIYCFGKDTKCNIYCQTNSACSNQTTIVYCWAIDNCNINCDPFNGIDCPKVVNITLEPTSIPSTIPTSIPTAIPSAIPSVIPTRIPSIIPTTIPSIVPSTVPTLMPTAIPTNQTENNDAAEIAIKNFDTAGLYFVSCILILSLFLLLIAIIYHYIIAKGSHLNNLFGLLRFFASVADFWTDLLFTAILYFESNREDNISNNNKNTYFLLFIVSTVCVGAAYLCSCIFGVYWISRMRITISGKKDSSHRLLKYFKQYDMFVYGMITIAGFYATIDLLRSKLFYLDIFNLQLTHEEYTSLKMYRFINIVLLENIPQFIVQIIYIHINLNINASDENGNNNINSIALLSVTLSVLSIIAASLSQMSMLCSNKCRNVEKYTYSHRCELTGSIVIKSNQLKKWHAFSHKKIEECISDVIETCKDSNLWNKRSDVFYTIQVYYIQNYINTLNQIQFSFEIIVLTIGDNIYDITNVLNENLQAMASSNNNNNMYNNNRILRKALIQNLKVTEIFKINVKEINMVIDEINKESQGKSDIDINARVPPVNEIGLATAALASIQLEGANAGEGVESGNNTREGASTTSTGVEDQLSQTD